VAAAAAFSFVLVAPTRRRFFVEFIDKAIAWNGRQICSPLKNRVLVKRESRKWCDP
jgi:hypothetical protein